jgi:hypothetical protein
MGESPGLGAIAVSGRPGTRFARSQQSRAGSDSASECGMFVPISPAELSLPCYEKRLAERIVGEKKV